MTTSPTGTDTGVGWQNLQPNTITTIRSTGTFDTAPQTASAMGTAIDASEAASIASTIGIHPPQMTADSLAPPSQALSIQNPLPEMYSIATASTVADPQALGARDIARPVTSEMRDRLQR